MMGRFECFEVTQGSFGQQYTTIDGRKYVTYLDLADPKLRGLAPGAQVEFRATEGPTALCNSPRVSENLPSAVLVRVVQASGTVMTMESGRAL